MGCFLISFVDSRGNDINIHDMAHQFWGNSSRVVANQDVVVSDLGLGNIVLEVRDITGEERFISQGPISSFNFGYSFGR